VYLTSRTSACDRDCELNNTKSRSKIAPPQVPTQGVVADAAASGVRRVALPESCIALPNRTMFRERLIEELARSRPLGREHALLYFELEGFAAIKDNYGSEIGDELLQIVGARLTHALRASDRVSRIGDGEFACLLGVLPSRVDLTRLACKLFDAVEAPVKIGNFKLALRPTIGIAINPGEGTTAELLLDNAITALARAKDQETGYAFYEELAVA